MLQSRKSNFEILIWLDHLTQNKIIVFEMQRVLFPQDPLRVEGKQNSQVKP